MARSYHGKCVVPSCNVNKRKLAFSVVGHISFHKFPMLKMHKKMRQKWTDIIRKLKNDDIWEPGFDQICSRHFNPSHMTVYPYDENMRMRTWLNPTALPTENLYSEAETTCEGSTSTNVKSKVTPPDVTVEVIEAEISQSPVASVSPALSIFDESDTRTETPPEIGNTDPIDLSSCKNCSEVLQRLLETGGVVLFRGRVFNVSSEEVIGSDSENLRQVEKVQIENNETDGSLGDTGTSHSPAQFSYSAEDYEAEDTEPFGSF